MTTTTRHRKPSREKRASFQSPEPGELWIRDIKAKATFYPIDQKAFNRLQKRLISEGKIIKTSQV